MTQSPLFSPLEINRFGLKNRIGVAPMTRMSSPGDSDARSPGNIPALSTHRYGDAAFGTGRTMSQRTREATNLPRMICGNICGRDTAEDADMVFGGKSPLLDSDRISDLRAGKPLRPIAQRMPMWHIPRNRFRKRRFKPFETGGMLWRP